MESKIKIPDNAIKYILFQRPIHLRTPEVFHRNLRKVDKLLPFAIYNKLVALEAKFRNEKIKELYVNEMRNEYISVKNFLPETCRAILDIGCGIAGFEVFINRHYSGRKVDLYLLDKTYVEDTVYYAFHSKGAFYNSLEIAKSTLLDNGVSNSCIHLMEVNDNNDIEIDSKVDLVISLISWGFHYPVETYVNKVRNILNKDGLVILDIKKGTNGLDVLKSRFCKVEVISEEKKHYRVIANGLSS